MDHEHNHEYMHEHGIPHDHHDHDAAHPHMGGTGHDHSHDQGVSHEHAHAHNHEHTHADGTTHTHEHGHVHEHPHGHAHEHSHGACPGAANCSSDCKSCDIDPRAEIVALMQYMVNHNTSHANELAQLAERLKDMGDVTACEQVMQAVSDFEKGNMRLSTVMAALK